MNDALLHHQSRRHVATTFVLALTIGLNAGCAGAIAEQQGSTGSTAGGATSIALSGRQATIDPTQLARRIHELVNVERARFGLQPLAWQPALAPVATGHSKDMAARDYFSHDSPDGQNFLARYKARNFQCSVPIDGNRLATGGENIAQTHTYAGFRVSPSGQRTPVGWRTLDEVANRVVQGWMDSPSHRENILRPYWRTQAIGVAIDSQGRVFATENFC